MKKIKIGNRMIGEGKPVFIIAEAGVNHNGKLSLAKRLIDIAVEAGADAVKFQTFITEEVISPDAPRAEHLLANVKEDISHFDLIKKLELPHEVFLRLKLHAEKRGLIFLSTPYDIPSARYLASIGVSVIKIASSEVTNLPLIDTIAEFKLPVIVSTGMNEIEDIKTALSSLGKSGQPVAILKCTSNYPTKYTNVNLRGILTLRNEFKDCIIGFSDHTKGNEAACAAVALGACIIEKHFTINRKLWGPDHRASLNPKELKKLIQSIRNVEKIMGSPKIQPLKSEKSQKETMQKSIYARRDIKKGKIISLDDLNFLRPSGGISPRDYLKIIGKKYRIKILAGTRLDINMLQVSDSEDCK